MNTSPSVGVGLKPEYFVEACDTPAEGLWFEAHPENYMMAGGPWLGWLEAIRSAHPLALHGVGMSLAADADPDEGHLARLAALVARFEPFLVSEHLAWSMWGGSYRPDLLPVPRTREALARVAANVSRVQDRLGRPIAIENPAHYVQFDSHEFSEIDFLDALSRRTGCALLLDVNNVYVSARNLGFGAEEYIDAFPAVAVAEIHLAGHSCDPLQGDALLIDSHDAPVAPAVWTLYRRLIERIGPRPTLIERDDKLPPFADLLAECGQVRAVLGEPALVES